MCYQHPGFRDLTCPNTCRMVSRILVTRLGKQWPRDMPNPLIPCLSLSAPYDRTKEIAFPTMVSSRSVISKTKLRLFADAAGLCQNPSCLRALFPDQCHLSIAEMAHIVAASDHGPRASTNSDLEDRESYDNLLLLCPTCHTMVDKVPRNYPRSLLIHWKQNHVTKIKATFSLDSYNSREDARKAIEPLMEENYAIFTSDGPNNEYRLDPESEQAQVWKRKVRSIILPNNRKILMILDKNRIMLSAREKCVLRKFRQHVEEMEERHRGDASTIGRQFPLGMRDILVGSA